MCVPNIWIVDDNAQHCLLYEKVMVDIISLRLKISHSHAFDVPLRLFWWIYPLKMQNVAFNAEIKNSHDIEILFMQMQSVR